MKKLILVGVLFAVATAACGADVDDAATTTAGSGLQEASGTGENPPPSESLPGDSNSPGGDSTEPPATTIPEERVVEEDELPERVPPPGDMPVTGEADAGLVGAIKQDLITRTGATESDINVVRSEEVIWNDGSLGCPVPGEMYTQALVEGFWVVLEHGGTEYDYRANDRGYFRLCEGFAAPPSNPTG